MERPLFRRAGDNNVLLFVDKILLPETDRFWNVEFAVWGIAAALLGLLLLLYGLIWDAE